MYREVRMPWGQGWRCQEVRMPRAHGWSGVAMV